MGFGGVVRSLLLNSRKMVGNPKGREMRRFGLSPTFSSRHERETVELLADERYRTRENGRTKPRKLPSLTNASAATGAHILTRQQKNYPKIFAAHLPGTVSRDKGYY